MSYGKCIVCNKEAVVRIPYAKATFCKDHFIKFYEQKIIRTLREIKFRGGKILVGVSGGKDSMALIFALNKLANELNIKVSALHIDLGISEYSAESRDIFVEAMKNWRIDYRVINVEDYLGVTIPEIVRVIKRPACSICGTVKRWILNKVAYENGYDYIATGHNIDDVSTFYLKALLTYREEDIIRGQDVITYPHKGFKAVGRIRPQLYLSERENLLYCIYNEIPFVEKSCPLARGALILKYKRLWEGILRVNPVAQINFVKTIIKIKRKLPAEDIELRECKVCGFPTTSRNSICSFCKIKMKAEGIKH